MFQDNNRTVHQEQFSLICSDLQTDTADYYLLKGINKSTILIG